MQHLISILFIVEFFLISIYFLFTLLKRELNFKLGISFGLLFFVFIPIWIMIFTGEVELSKSDFGSTSLKDIVLVDNIKSSLAFLAFIFSIIVYLYFPSLKKNSKNVQQLKPTIFLYLIIYIIGMLIILIGSGLLKGGNWYDNRHDFFISSGALAILIAFVLNASKILIISSLFQKWINNNYSLFKFIVLLFSFTFIDMVFTGNRIYLFCSAIAFGLLLFKKYPRKVFFSLPIVLPGVFVLGYFASIFRHIRGPLFMKGMPTYDVFINALIRAISLEPPKPTSFFLGISESVNVNVVYELFNSYESFLYGATYLKPLFFYFPRSIWESKPESITVIAANNFGGASLVTTIIGEMYMNFHLLGIIVLPVLLWFLDNILSKSLDRYGSIAGIILFVFGILFFRMPFSDELLVFIFLILILKLCNIISKYKLRIK